MSKKAMNLALEALELNDAPLNNETVVLWERKIDEAITALREALASGAIEQPAQQQEFVGCEGAVVNGRVYADRLEHDYKFECEAGPLHLCNDWVEFRRCFEWLAQHTPQPAQQQQQQEPLTDDPLQGAVDWLLEADGVYFRTVTVQRTLRIGYNRAKRLCDTAKERAAHGIKENT